MQKIFYTLLILSTSLFSYTTIKNLNYESGISIYGKIGTVRLTLEENHDAKTYKMVAKTTSTGVVKFLSGNRIDTFTSEGKIVDSIYQPLKFTRHTSKNESEKTRIYIFNYLKKTVHKTEITSAVVLNSEFDTETFGFIDKEETVVKTKKETIDFEQNDFLSLYLNLIKGNLYTGEVPYIDMKEKDTLIYVRDNLFEVHKNFGEDKYSIVMVPDEKSIFFQQVRSVEISFYGDAYIKKISESTKTID